MKANRWREIERLYHSAREHGVGVLLETDPEIREEVERLLARDSSGSMILDHRADNLLRQVMGPEVERKTIQHYKILEQIGAGGMGVVYKALDTKLGRTVALKFLPPRLSHDPELKRRLTAEARAASALDHPNITVIHSIDETEEGDLFIAMAFHEGVTLREKITAGLAVKESLGIARQIASGLKKAHEHGITHRDIKPSNVMVADDGVARIIDFGLAKSSDLTATLEGSTRGTPLYMSPEQASGGAVDYRTDLWSLGAVLYEMLAGKPPFTGDTQLQVLHGVLYNDPAKLGDEIPAAVQAVVSRALQKEAGQRYQSATEMLDQLSEALPERVAVRARYAVPAALLLLCALTAGVWFYLRSERRHWAREQAIPQISRLVSENKPVAAFRLAQKARRYVPADAQLAKLDETLMNEVAVRSSPAGALVEIKDYLSAEDEWLPIGRTPLDKVKIPAGYLRWRVSKHGFQELTGARVNEDIHGPIRQFDFALDAAAAAPAGMAAVPATKFFEYIWSLGEIGPYDLPAFSIDRFEVTNREYQEFVDRHGYEKREYWKEKFVQDGRELNWEQASKLLRDSTGRPGPSTWAAGHYPAGQADFPVGGVSWYEASAYAEFAGKALPAISQWYLAAPISVARFIEPQSNFTASPAAVGKYAGVGPWGTYDMAGNVAEWCRNGGGVGSRYLLGGGFNTTPNEYYEPGTQPEFHRAANSGFRCVRNSGPIPAQALAERVQTNQDFSKAKPASDAVFRIYKALYAYDRTPLNAKVEAVEQDSADWRKEKITLDAAYGKERFTLFLLMPVTVKPPYQAIVFFPSARVLDAPTSKALADMKFIDYAIGSGRAVVYPIYKGTYERTATPPGPDTVAGRETLIQDSKDIGRAIDYLQTRSDFDSKRIAFLGESMGAALGVDLVAVEDRFRAAIFLDGGFYSEHAVAGADQADFAARIKIPTLLITGKFDWIFTGKSELLKLMGAPAAGKKGVLLNTAHDVSEQRADLVREVVDWLDRYLGRVE